MKEFKAGVVAILKVPLVPEVEHEARPIPLQRWSTAQSATVRVAPLQRKLLPVRVV